MVGPNFWPKVDKNTPKSYNREMLMPYPVNLQSYLLISLPTLIISESLKKKSKYLEEKRFRARLS